MVKKQNNNAWLVYVIALIAIVALVLAIVAMNKASMTGNAFWDFLRTKEVVAEQTQTTYIPETAGVLGSAYLAKGGSAEILKGYRAEYNDDGALMYEIILEEDGELLIPGEGYELSEDPNGGYIMYSPGGGGSQSGWSCTCSGSECGSGACHQVQPLFSNNLKCKGKCSGNNCNQNRCSHSYSNE